MFKLFVKISKFLLIFVVITGWFFSGWPRIWPLGGFDKSLDPELGTEGLTTSELGVNPHTKNFGVEINKIRIPPEIQEVNAQDAPLGPALSDIDNFNYHRPGVLYQQGVWNGQKSGKDWQVIDALNCPVGSPDGGHCLGLSSDATAEFENMIDTRNPAILPYRNNLVSFYFYPNWQGEPTVAFNLYWRSPTDEFEQVRLDFNTQEGNFFYIFLSDGETDAVVFNLPLKQWHKVELNIDKNNRQARFRVNGGEWTNFVSWINHGEPIGLLRLGGMVDGEANFYVDDFSVSEFIP